MVEWYWQGKTDNLWGKPVPVPLCPSQIPHKLLWARTWDFVIIILTEHTFRVVSRDTYCFICVYTYILIEQSRVVPEESMGGATIPQHYIVHFSRPKCRVSCRVQGTEIYRINLCCQTFICVHKAMIWGHKNSLILELGGGCKVVLHWKKYCTLPQECTA
jgi:hypothetical protein